MGGGGGRGGGGGGGGEEEEERISSNNNNNVDDDDITATVTVAVTVPCHCHSTAKARSPTDRIFHTPSSCFASLSSLIFYGPLQSSSRSVHSNGGSDSHLLIFTRPVDIGHGRLGGK